jgi:hypothetical protein
VIDLAPLLQILGFTALVVTPPIVLNRLLADSDGPVLADLLRIPIDPPRPRGVQEEEPVPWRIDRLRRPSAAAEAPAKACRPRGAQPPGFSQERGVG